MAEYSHRGHTVTELKYHFVWVTKYRYPVLRGEVAVRARELIRQICEAREITIIKGVVSRDHVHVYVSAPSHLSPAQMMQWLKGRSSRRLQEEFAELRRR
jgi:putative transposase